MPKRDWYADDTFWNDLYGHIFTTKHEAAAREEVTSVLALSGLQSGAVLDMPCGPGRHALPLAERGFTVTGVDLNERLLARARQRCAAVEERTAFICEDMRRFVRPRSFTLAISMFNSLGYFEDPADDLKIVHNIEQSLRPGGKLFLELVSREYLQQNHQPLRYHETDNGSRLAQELELLDDGRRIRNIWRREDDDEAYCFEQRVFAAREIEALLIKAGFATISLYGTFAGAPYDKNARRLIAVAVKE